MCVESEVMFRCFDEAVARAAVVLVLVLLVWVDAEEVVVTGSGARERCNSTDDNSTPYS